MLHADSQQPSPKPYERCQGSERGICLVPKLHELGNEENTPPPNSGRSYWRALALAACLLAFGGCAATDSVLSGHRIETRPVFAPPQSAPLASRRADGNLVLTAHFQTTQKATTGDLFSSGRSVSSEKKVIVVPASELRPAENVLAGIFKPYDRAMLRTMLNTPIDPRSPKTKNAKLKVLNGWPTNGSQFVCPSHECVIYSSDFVWYVPSSFPNGSARAAVIPVLQQRTPLSAYPKRAALLPAAIVGDLIINTWVGAASLSGRQIDL